MPDHDRQPHHGKHTCTGEEEHGALEKRSDFTLAGGVPTDLLDGKGPQPKFREDSKWVRKSQDIRVPAQFLGTQVTNHRDRDSEVDYLDDHLGRDKGSHIAEQASTYYHSLSRLPNYCSHTWSADGGPVHRTPPFPVNDRQGDYSTLQRLACLNNQKASHHQRREYPEGPHNPYDDNHIRTNGMCH